MENKVKEAAVRYNFISPDEYLEMDRASEERNEYYDGLVLPMTGASMAHNVLNRNLIGILYSHLKGKECEVLPSHMRVSTPGRENYMYPHTTVSHRQPDGAWQFEKLDETAAEFQTIQFSLSINELYDGTTL